MVTSEKFYLGNFCEI